LVKRLFIMNYPKEQILGEIIDRGIKKKNSASFKPKHTTI